MYSIRVSGKMENDMVRVGSLGRLVHSDGDIYEGEW